MRDTFRPIAVHELLSGEHRFYIPSYQRGYRWEEKQVEDLLDDILQFTVNNRHADNARYYLQPLVTRRVDIGGREWREVLDGQQRLTTLYLILDCLGVPAYELKYARKSIDFANLDPGASIDSYYLLEAKRKIEKWMAALGSGRLRDDFKYALVDPENYCKAYFIWYEVEATGGHEEKNTLKSIKVFNNLNKGKINLTSSELVKALLVLDYEKRGLSSEQLAVEWNEIERQFQNDEFWKFISNDSPQSRVDILFDFMTQKPARADSDYAYRKFQNLFDYCQTSDPPKRQAYYEHRLDPLWKQPGHEVLTMQDAWTEIKKTHDRLVSWFEDAMLYHYVGYLVATGLTPLAIWRSLRQAKSDKAKKAREQARKEGRELDADSALASWTAEDTEDALRRLIMRGFMKGDDEYYAVDDIDDWRYDNGREHELIRRALLLFNIETYRHARGQRFSFSDFKNEKWDIEHIDSQCDSGLDNSADWLRWLRNASFILKMEPAGSDGAKSPARELAEEIDRFVWVKTDGGKIRDKDVQRMRAAYRAFYNRVAEYYSSSVPGAESLSRDAKHGIGNLTLLNAPINRSYHDAPFPYKRYCVINFVDKDGKEFIPMCTRNVFLKYYTDPATSASHINAQRWHAADSRDYLKAIKERLAPIFNAIKDK